MCIMKISIIIASMLLNTNFTFVKNNENKHCRIEIRIEKPETPFHLKESKDVYLIITNKGDQPILFPEYLNIGEVFGEFETDLVFEIKMKDPINKKFNFLNYYLEFSRIELPRKNVSIGTKQTIRIKQNLGLITQLDSIGEYQIRAKVKLIDNECRCEFETNWIKFKIVE